MKYRNGFVSNSSSASFVLAFPKENPVELKNIEDYFGGFGEELEPEVKDTFAFDISLMVLEQVTKFKMSNLSMMLNGRNYFQWTKSNYLDLAL